MTWIGEQWRGLLDLGVDQVSLFEDSRREYGPMSLRPDGDPGPSTYAGEA